MPARGSARPSSSSSTCRAGRCSTWAPDPASWRWLPSALAPIPSRRSIDDPDAVAAAADNLVLNAASGRVGLRQADFRSLSSLSADIVTANLTGALLARSAGPLAAAVRPGGSLIVSGVTAEEETMVLDAFQPYLRLASRLAEEGWVGLLFRRA